VHVRVDEAGQQREVAQVDVGHRVDRCVVCLDRDDRLPAHRDGRGPLAVRGDGSLGPHDEIEHKAEPN
jgi:hypothetical protein